MLYRFKSRAAADLLMLGPNAQALLRLIGKDPQGPGILTCEQMPAALQRLQQAIEAEAGGAAVDTGDADPADQADDAERPEAEDRITLSQRAWPLMQMIERSLADNHPIIWGD